VRVLGVLSGMPGMLLRMHSGWVLEWVLLSIVYLLLSSPVEFLSESLTTNTEMLKSINERDRVSRGRAASIPQGTKRIVEVGVGTRNRGPEGL
jgi:putative exporter of polyketide antibiotics